MPGTRRMQDPEGFTLIELMIVVAIIGILAAIAIPNFTRFQLRSRVGEGKVNLAAIRTAEEAYMMEYARYVPIGSTPQAVGVIGLGGVGNVKVSWPACPNPVGLGAPGHCIVGWRPDGPTYYNYTVTVSPAQNSYSAVAESDIDGDGTINYWGIERPNALGVVTAPSANPGCGIGSVLDTSFNPPVAGQMNLVGPCGFGLGMTVF